MHYGIGYGNGQRDVVENILYDENVMREISSSEVMANLTEHFSEKLNFTQLLVWESDRLQYTNANIARFTNPTEILRQGLGRCGEFSILYVAICLTNDIPARLVVPTIIVSGVVDHAWAEVNPSKDDKTWIHVDPTDSCVAIQSGKSIDELTTINNPLMYKNRNYQMILAFQITSERQILIIDRTAYYS